MKFRLSIVSAAAILLAACGGTEEVVKTEEGADAQGEILGGSISDAMVPLEEVRSVSPPAKREAGEGGETSSNSGSQSQEASAETEAEEQSETAETDAAESPASEPAEPAEEG